MEQMKKNSATPGMIELSRAGCALMQYGSQLAAANPCWNLLSQILDAPEGVLLGSR